MESIEHVESLKDALSDATNKARAWFEAKSPALHRPEFEQRSKKGESPKCAVYVYYGDDGTALYVGQSKRRIKLRLHDQISPHRLKAWWASWATVRHLTLQDETDRLVLELMLILAYAPPHNRKPAGKDVAALFAP